MLGAPAFAALGALRAGCGLALLLCPEPLIIDVLQLVPSATAVALTVDPDGELLASSAAEALDAALIQTTTLIVGPGMGITSAAQAIALRAVQQEQCPVIVDADALTMLAKVPDLTRDFRARAVLTPHPGEFRRLAEALRITADPVDPSTRSAAAEQLARRIGCIVVLKGDRTVVTDGLDTWVCQRGHPCMATAGSGDVLAGVIAGIIAQHPPKAHNPLIALAAAKSGRPLPAQGPHQLSLIELTCIAVEAHAIAGELWAAQNEASGGMLATELASLIPRAVEGLRSTSKLI